MQLWTDYEGVTIDGAFSLQKLLLPEGRSAFFSTAGPKGEPTVVRLIECHFDEEEILARWRCVEALRHPNFLKFEQYGQTELDGRPVVYAVFEKVDGNLAEVLDEGHLTVKDAAQLAASLVSALDVLHTHGFIHEHIEPRNIFAVNDQVRLRSDCIREAPEGEEGRAAKQRDVRDLATVLLQALTQRQLLDGIPDSAIPPPFGPIIRNGLDGSWGLVNIKTTLESIFGSKQPAPPKTVNGAAATLVVVEKPAAVEKKVPSVQNVPGIQQATRTDAKPSSPTEAQIPLPLFEEKQSAGFARAYSRKDPWGAEDASGQTDSFSLRSRWIGAAGIFALLLLLVTWGLVHAWNAHRHNTTQAAEAISQPAALSPKQVTKPEAGSPALRNTGTNSSRVGAASGGSRAGWRVIPFTYNRIKDAEKKVSDLARSHPELRPAVFTPSGHAPYMVSIGGVMDREAAYALAHRSRSLGLPSDTYAQNYSH
jgi:eukaryotic-like serine/threonine-protein kinase